MLCAVLRLNNRSEQACLLVCGIVFVSLGLFVFLGLFVVVLVLALF